MRTDREELVTATQQDRLFGIDPSAPHAAVRDIANRDPLPEIGPGYDFFLCHVILVATLKRDDRTLHQMGRSDREASPTPS